MKKILLSFFIMITAVAAAQKNNPLSYPYYINGITEIGQNGEIYLKEIKTKGFSYTDYNQKGHENIANEKAAFIFEKITTTPAISLSSYPNLQYWRKAPSGDWITDAEGGSGTFNNKLEKDITIVMVLDCSTSLGDDFQKVKDYAISFMRKIFHG